MNPQKAVDLLVKTGLNHAEIARILTESGLPTSQPTIYRIATGQTSNPKFELGAALIALSEERCTKPRRGKAA